MLEFAKYVLLMVDNLINSTNYCWFWHLYSILFELLFKIPNHDILKYDTDLASPLNDVEIWRGWLFFKDVLRLGVKQMYMNHHLDILITFDTKRLLFLKLNYDNCL